MTSQELLRADVLDILFEHRNKAYGAYALRKNYSHRMTIALMTALSVVVVLLLLIRPGTSRVTATHSAPGVVISTGLIPPLPPKAPEAPKPPSVPKGKPIETMENKPPLIVKDRIDMPPLPDVTELTEATLAGETNHGEKGLPGIVNGTPESNVAVTVAEEKPRTVLPEQREPEFPGGVEAWLKFLQKNLMSPGELEPGEKKMVLVRFEVAEDGAVTGMTVVQSGGSEFDREVIRVLRKMPKWKPAVHNGLPVSRYFTQPVTFMAQAY